MILYFKVPRKAIRKTIGCDKYFSKVAGCKITTQKSKPTEKQIRKNVPFALAWEREEDRERGNNPHKRGERPSQWQLYDNEKEIEEETRRWKTVYAHWISIVKMLSRFNEEVPHNYFDYIQQRTGTENP